MSICECNLSLSEPILVRGTELNKPICYKDVSILGYDKVLPVKWFLTLQRNVAVICKGSQYCNIHLPKVGAQFNY